MNKQAGFMEYAILSILSKKGEHYATTIGL